jgi:hypothetical protein
MISMPKGLPDDPVLLKQLLEQMLSERESDKGKIVHLEEKNALLRQRLFGRQSEQTADPTTSQIALFNEAESVAEPVDETVEEEVVAPTKRRGKRQPLPADLPRIEVIHEPPDHELTCSCACAVNTALARKSASSSRSCRCKSWMWGKPAGRRISL